MDHVWICKCCGKQYGTLPFAYALDEPDAWHAIPEAERQGRGVLTKDQCAIDNREFYIRGRMEIPVIGDRESHIWGAFVWGVWVSVSADSFDRIGQLWDVKIREHEPPISGWLGNDISIYPPTFNLKCNLHLRNDGQRPSIVLEPTNHPLAAEQRSGISLERVKEIAATVLRHS